MGWISLFIKLATFIIASQQMSAIAHEVLSGFPHSPLENLRMDRTIDDDFEEGNLHHFKNQSHNRLDFLSQEELIGEGLQDALPPHRGNCIPHWIRIPSGYLRYYMSYLDKFTPGVSHDQKSKFAFRRDRVENINMCARRCLLGSGCDMFTIFYTSWSQTGKVYYTCAYFPHLKLKTKILSQISLKLQDGHPYNIYVLQCDESQKNSLPPAFSHEGTLAPGWSETQSDGRQNTYLATKQSLYFENLLPACSSNFIDYDGRECLYNGKVVTGSDNKQSFWAVKADMCYIAFGHLVVIKDVKKMEFLQTIQTPGSDGIINRYRTWTAGKQLNYGPNQPYYWAKSPVENEHATNILWGPGQPDDTDDFSANTRAALQPNGYRNCIGFSSTHKALGDMECQSGYTYFVCEKLRDLVGLGGEADGHAVERAVIGDNPFTYQLAGQLVNSDVDLPQEYLDTFQPRAILKTWVRNHHTQAAANRLFDRDAVTETADLSLAIGGQSSDLAGLKANDSTLSVPMVVVMDPLPHASLPLDITLDIVTASPNGMVLYTPPEVIIDQPIPMGCYKTIAGEFETTTAASPPECLVYCHGQSRRFAMLSGTACSCLTELSTREDLALAKMSKCTIQCPGTANKYKCGGDGYMSVYVADCESGFKRFGAFCYAEVGTGALFDLESKCLDLEANLWAPRRVGDVEMVSTMFPSSNKEYHLGVANRQRIYQGVRFLDNTVMPGEYPIFYGSGEVMGETRTGAYEKMFIGAEPITDFTTYEGRNGLVLDLNNDPFTISVKASSAALGVCQKPLALGYGYLDLLNLTSVKYEIKDSMVESVKVLNATQDPFPGIPGLPLAIEALRGSRMTQWFEIYFDQAVVMNGIIVNADKTFYLKSFYLYLNRFYNQWPDYEMNEHYTKINVFYGSINNEPGIMKKRYMFSNPVVIERLKFRLYEYAAIVKIKIQILGIPGPKTMYEDIINYGIGQSRAKELTAGEDEWVLDGELCPKGGAHFAAFVNNAPPAASEQGVKMIFAGDGDTEILAVSTILGPTNIQVIINAGEPVNPEPALAYNQTLHLYVTCHTDKFKVFVNNKVLAEYTGSHGDTMPSIKKILVTTNTSLLADPGLEVMDFVSTEVGSADKKMKIPCSGDEKCPKIISEFGKTIQVYEPTPDKEVDYMLGVPNWKCYRDVYYNTYCSLAFLYWHTMKIGGKSNTHAPVCPDSETNIALGEQCVRHVDEELTHQEATDRCLELETTFMLPPVNLIQSSVVSAYAERKGMTTFWIGAKRANETEWRLSNGRMLGINKIKIVNPAEPGDCLVADPARGYHAKIVSCDEKHKFFCHVGPNCPEGYEWVPSMGRKCLKLTEYPGGHRYHVDFYSGEKICLRDKTRMVTPRTSSEVNGLMEWLIGIRRSYSHYDVLLGWKTITIDTVSYYRSSFSSVLLNETDFLSIFNLTGGPCFKVSTVNEGAQGPMQVKTSDCAIQIIKNDQLGIDDPDVKTVCEYSECVTNSGQLCVFPFRYKNKWYDTCITIDSDTPWCSLQTDINGDHIPLAGSRGQCSDSCHVQNCPVGFYIFNNTCLHQSGRTDHDSQNSFDDARAMCNELSSRLYQPRDFKSIDGLIQQEPEVYNPNKQSTSHFSYRPSYISYLALGAHSSDFVPNYEAYYDDGTRAYMFEKRWEIIETNHNTLTNLFSGFSGKACINFKNTARISIEKCSNYYSNTYRNQSSDRMLGYVCEAKPFVTIGGGVVNKSCVFPFRLENSTKWHYSCAYNDAYSQPWCPTETKNGIAVADKLGHCENEQTLAFDGPGSGKQCIFPFFFGGIWRETCITEHYNKLWCPTSLNESRIFDVTNDEHGYCTDFFKVPSDSDCPAHYTLISGICVRVSPYALTYEDAEAQCKKEGSHLLVVDRDDIKDNLADHIKNESIEKEYYEPKYSPDLSAFWIGARASNQIWFWTSTGKNISGYSDWQDGEVNKGCIQGICTDNFAMTLQAEKLYKWSADDMAKKKPYICQYNCPPKYKFFHSLGKCVKIVSSKNGKTLSNAMLACAQENSHLVQLTDCNTKDKLSEDLGLYLQGLKYDYWVGHFVLGFDNYPSKRIMTSNFSGLTSGGWISKTDCPWTDLGGNDVSSFAKLGQNGNYPNESVMSYNPFYLADNSTERGFLCELNTDWTCPEGFIMFQEECYYFEKNAESFFAAQLKCRDNNSRLMEPNTLLHINFLNTFITTNIENGFVWTGFSKKLFDLQDDKIFSSSNFEQVSLLQKDDLVGTGDCISINISDFKWQWRECTEKYNYICQTDQIPTNLKREVIYQPTFVLPLNNLTVPEASETMVSFPNEPVLETELARSASFLDHSSISISKNESFSSKGISVACWLRFPPAAGNSTTLLDFSSPDNPEQLKLFIEDNKIKAAMCHNDSCDSLVTFSSFHEVSSAYWTFVAFTYDPKSLEGTFFVNNSFGNGSVEHSHFYVNASNWFTKEATQGPLNIGSKADAAAPSLPAGFNWRMSCLQVFSKPFSPSQIRELSLTCHLPPDFERRHACPQSYVSFEDHCFKFIPTAKTYAEAQADCVQDSTFYQPSELAFPKNYLVQAYLSEYALQNHNVSDIWLGIDAFSVHPPDFTEWMDIRGDKWSSDKINWAPGFPQVDIDKYCVISSHSLNSRLVNTNCSELYPFFCSIPKLKRIDCPKGQISYKGACLAHHRSVSNMSEGQNLCSRHGSIALPIKSRGMYEFVKRLGVALKAGNLYLGFNFTEGEPHMYSDGTEYVSGTSYDFDVDDESKFMEKQCAWLKKGLGFLPRSTECEAEGEVLCMWQAPNCPDGYTLHKGASNGRTCYSLSTGSSKFADADCSRPKSHLERVALPEDEDAIDVAKPSTSYAYIDGFSSGDTKWLTKAPRQEDEFSSPELVVDCSKERSWVAGAMGSGHQLADELTPNSVKMKPEICEGSGERFILQGTFNARGLYLKPPTVKIAVDNDNILLKWSFYKGGVRGSESNNSFLVMSSLDGKVTNKVEHVLDGHNLDADLDFNVTIACEQSNKLTVTMNNKWSESLEFNASAVNLTLVESVQINGAFKINFAGYGGKSCLKLSPHGRVVPAVASECDESLPAVCEYTACYTTQGFECIFPFTYKNVEYENCSTADVYLPWCPTSLGNNGSIETWGLCQSDCPAEELKPSCLHPPPRPTFGLADDPHRPNYVPSWFQVAFSDVHGLLFNVSRNVTFRYVPHEYDPANASQVVEMIMANSQENFYPLYEPMPEGTVVNYSCPTGFVFEGTNNKTLYQRCANWTWQFESLFDEARYCVPVRCNATHLPVSMGLRVNASDDHEERKSADPENWNSYLSRVTYTCPTGYVVQLPNVDNETVAEFEVFCDEEARWRPDLNHTRMPAPPVMPTCIAKNCTEPPFIVPYNDFGQMNWTEVPGNARPYSTEIVYYCPRASWGFPSTGLNTTVARCGDDGNWNLTYVEKCNKLLCPKQPPPKHPGEGALRIYGLEYTRYRCPDGEMFVNGDFPFWDNECLPTKQWEMPDKPMPCKRRECEVRPPAPFTGMEIIWPNKARSLGDKIVYRCPNGHYLDDVPLDDDEEMPLSGMSWSLYGKISSPYRDQTVECIWSNDTMQGHNDSMIWEPNELRPCLGVIPPPEDVVVLPTNAPYAVDYPSTTSYYWPHVSDNISMISNGGLASYQEEPVSGPFGFGPAHKLLKDKCVIDGDFSFDHDDCIKNPINCQHGLSFSIWEKVDHPRYVLELDPTTTVYPKKYVFSTGGDYDGDKTVPGFAVFHQGLNVIALLSTGEDVWEVNVQGSFKNNSFSNIGVRWAQPTTDPQVIDPNQFGGLELYVDLEKVGHSIYPMERPASGWTALPPVSLDAQDPSGALIPGKKEGPAVMMFGCHYDQIEGGADVSPPKFGGYLNGVLDEMAIWTRKLVTNKTVDETLYFLGGYVSQLEDMSSEKFAELLKKVDMSDPDQAAAAGSMANTLFSNQPPEEDAADSGNLSAPEDPDSPYPKPTTWKEIEKYKQLKLADTYKGILDMVGAVPGSLPHHIDARFETITVASQILSCTQKNRQRWKIVQEDGDQPGSSEIVTTIEDYAMEYMLSSNINHYDDTKYFNSSTHHYNVNLETESMFMSVQKMYMDRYIRKSKTYFDPKANVNRSEPMYNVQAYREPRDKWSMARALWPSPTDEIYLPNRIFNDYPECWQNPVTFMYAIYPCYGDYAPLRRSMVTIRANRFVVDSKVISVKFHLSNDTAWKEAVYGNCSALTENMRYNPVRVKFFHKSKETSRRKLMFHDDEIKTSIEVRRCVRWNEDIGRFGAWDADRSKTVMTELDSTICEFATFGTYAVIAEKIEKPIGRRTYTWLNVSKYIGFVISIISLLFFILVIMTSPHLWEMFHLIRLNTGLCYLFALTFHFVAELKQVQEDRHYNAAIASCLVFFYLSGSFFQMLEAFAEFRAITSGVVGGKTAAYIPLGWAGGFACLGLTWFMYGTDVGTDPNVFIGWNNETKLPFYAMNYFALGSALILSSIIIINASSPQTRKADVVEDLQLQGQGLAITNFFFVVVWAFAYPAFMKFPGVEMREFYPVFSIFNAWQGLIILIFLGFSSKKFRYVLSRCFKKKGSKHRAPEDQQPIVVESAVTTAPGTPASSRPGSAVEEDPVESRPGSGTSKAGDEEEGGSRPTSATTLPGTVENDEEEEEEEEAGEENDGEDDEEPEEEAEEEEGENEDNKEEE